LRYVMNTAVRLRVAIFNNSNNKKVEEGGGEGFFLFFLFHTTGHKNQ